MAGIIGSLPALWDLASTKKISHMTISRTEKNSVPVKISVSGDKKYSRDLREGDIRINTGFYQFRIDCIVIVTRKKSRSEVFLWPSF